MTYYYDFDIQLMLDVWAERGGAARDVIDPVDGFHPSQVGMALQAEYIWDYVLKEHPETIGEENKWNAEIIEKFGDEQFHGPRTESQTTDNPITSTTTSTTLASTTLEVTTYSDLVTYSESSGSSWIYISLLLVIGLVL